MKRKTNFVLGEDLEEALRNLKSPQGAPVTKKASDPAPRSRASRKPYAAMADSDDLFRWLRLIAPGELNRWCWLVILHWQVCRRGPLVAISDLAKAMAVEPQKVEQAIVELCDAGYVRIDTDSQDDRSRALGPVVKLKLGGQWGDETIFS